MYNYINEIAHFMCYDILICC